MIAMPPTVRPNRIPPNVVSIARSATKPPMTKPRPAMAVPRIKVAGLFNGISMILGVKRFSLIQIFQMNAQ